MNLSKILAATLVGVSLSALAFAGPRSSSVDPRTMDKTVPTPLTVVQPTQLPTRYENADVELTLTIDEAGVPHDVAPYRVMPKDLAARLLPAVQQWRFNPAMQNGKPVRTRVILPLKLVDGA